MNKRTPERALFIVWRWKEADALWHTAEDQSHLHCISENWLFEEETLEIIAGHLRAYSTLPQCLIFLHRTRHPHSYVRDFFRFMQEKLNLKETGKLKCILFGGGDDFLYLKKNPKGLLGDGELGGWIGYGDDPKAEIKVIEDAQKKTIRQDHFNSVWNYYQHEFKMKVYRLERDLSVHFAPFTEPGYSQNDVSLYAHLEKDTPLSLRLLSFVGEKIEEEEASQYQEELFDDCAENLKAAYGQKASEVYSQLRKSIDEVLLGNSLEKIPPHIAIPQVRRQFMQLRDLMPERITY